MLGEIDRDLYLLVAGHAPLEGIRALQHRVDVTGLLRRYRQVEFPVHHEVRQIRAQTQLRHVPEHLDGEIEIIQRAVTVGFQQHRKIMRPRHLEPGTNHRDCIGSAERHHAADHIDLRSLQFPRHREQRPQFLHRVRKGVDHALEAVTLEERRESEAGSDLVDCGIEAHAVIARRRDAREVQLRRRLLAARDALLHAPEGLINAQALHAQNGVRKEAA